jgi:NADH-quinone oxidoreductase subunit L
VVEAHYMPFLPWSLSWLAPFIGALLIAVAWMLRVRDERVYGYTSVLSILASALVSSYVAVNVFSKGPLYAGRDLMWVSWLGVSLGTYYDGLSALMAVVVSWISLLIAVYSVKYMEGDWGYGRYFFFFTFFVGSMMLLVLADNLILLFVGWEGTGLCSYALISHWYTDEEDKWVGRPGRRVLGYPMYFEPSHSGVRAILFTRVGDLGFLVGIAVLYTVAGTFNIVALASTAPEWLSSLASKGVLLLTLLILTLGALAKSAQFPFHEWLVTAMTGPTPISALIHAATMVKAGIYLFLRLTPILVAGALALTATPDYTIVSSQLQSYYTIIAYIGAFTAFMLASMALVSDELKLILAYSTASQIGYMFLGASASGLLLGAEGVVSGFSHLVSHAIFKASLFLIAGWLIHVAHSRFIDPMGGYAKYMKLTALALWLSGLSLAGVPPLSGFFSKEMVIHVAYTASPLLAVAAITAAVLTAAYTLRVVVRVLHTPPYTGAGARHQEHHLGEAPLTMLIPYLALALISLVIGLSWPTLSEVYSKMSELTLAIGSPVEAHIELSGLTLATVAVILATVVAVSTLYAIVRANLYALAQKAPLDKLYNFLYDRWYANSIIYMVFLGGGIRATGLLKEADIGIDYTYHSLTPRAGSLGAWILRSLHRGRTEYYITLYLISVAVIILVLLLAR